MITTNKKKPGMTQHEPARKSAQQQLWKLLKPQERTILSSLFHSIKKRDQEALCYAFISYLRFKVNRPFDSPFLQAIYLTTIELFHERA